MLPDKQKDSCGLDLLGHEKRLQDEGGVRQQVVQVLRPSLPRRLALQHLQCPAAEMKPLHLFLEGGRKFCKPCGLVDGGSCSVGRIKGQSHPVGEKSLWACLVLSWPMGEHKTDATTQSKRIRSGGALVGRAEARRPCLRRLSVPRIPAGL